MSDSLDLCGCGVNRCTPELDDDGEQTGYCSACGEHIGHRDFETGNHDGRWGL